MNPVTGRRWPRVPLACPTGPPYHGVRSPNEKFCLENYYKGILSVVHFLEKLAA